jgi:hypothetical protein
LAPFGFKVLVNRILIEAGRRLSPTFNYVRDAPSGREPLVFDSLYTDSGVPT